MCVFTTLTQPLPQVAHLSYNTAFPHTLFNPYHCLAQLEGQGQLERQENGSSSNSSSGGLAVAMYSGDSVRYVHAAVSRNAVQATPAAQVLQSGSRSGEAEGGTGTSRDSLAVAQEMPGAGSPPQPQLLGHGVAELQQGQEQQQPQEQEQQALQQSPPAALSPLGTSPWQQRQRQRRHSHEQLPLPAGGRWDCDLGAHFAVISCTHAIDSSSSQLQPRHSIISGSCSGDMAAVSMAAAPQQLDLEESIFEALQQQGLPPSALLNYAAAPMLGGCWEGQDGLLLLAVLCLVRPAAAQQQQHQVDPGGRQISSPAPAHHAHQQQQQQAPQPPQRSACVLVHAAAGSGAPRLVEWLEPPYPWHNDLSAFMVQQTAFAGLAFEKAPAFFGDFMRSQYCVPPPRRRLPLVLTNRSVLGTGTSLQHIAHPYLPEAILGYNGAV
jgi:hypothetical protein